jgi:hypothetical protein
MNAVLLRALLIAVGITFLAYAAIEIVAGWPSSFAELWGSVWGRVVFVDLMLGIALFAGIVCWREPSALKRILWIASFFILGNAATAFYLSTQIPSSELKT